MDVSRGDRVMWGRDVVVIDNATPDARGWITGIMPTGNRAQVHPDDLSPVPPDVVTLTLEKGEHKVSEEMSVAEWRRWISDRLTGPAGRAARALAEKVDGKENPDG